MTIELAMLRRSNVTAVYGLAALDDSYSDQNNKGEQDVLVGLY